MNNSSLKNKYLEWHSGGNFLAYKKVKNKCNSLRRKRKRKYVANTAKVESNQTSKSFWDSVKPSIASKCTVSEENIVIKA